MWKTLPLLLASALVCASLQAMTPDEAQKELFEGNRRYMRDELRNNDNKAARRAALISKQHPFATILGCSDSRVSPEIIFDQSIGDLFVVRVAGNVVGGIEIDSIEYAAHHLGAQLLLVLGHENCGAVDAVLTKNAADIPTVAGKIAPALKGISQNQPDALKKAVIANVRQSVAELSATPVLAKLIQKGELKIIGGYYNLMNGEVSLIEEPKNP